ncbi:MAG: LON peptidase substrate-binding domain-containing protein [Kofleriaceae bacterium]|nr:LON peptidase substrate-binding domain-containing protein [Kofleriaceae bacterium]
MDDEEQRDDLPRPPRRRPTTAPRPPVDDLDPSALRRLAIFPLPNAVLLPGGMMPLHVFEPRYREMTRDALAGSRLIAVALLAPGYEADYHGRPAVQPIAGLGRIICADELPDGRYHLLLRGVGRVRIDEELPATTTYRQVRASLLDDRDSVRTTGELVAAHRQLLAICDRLSLALDHGGCELAELIHAQPTAGECADVITAALVTDPRRRQTLLETLDPADRVAAAVELVATILCQLAPETLN